MEQCARAFDLFGADDGYTGACLSQALEPLFAKVE